jgi:dynactin complex subunit
MQINKLCRLTRDLLKEHLSIQYNFYQLKSIKSFDIGFTIKPKKNKTGPITAEVIIAICSHCPNQSAEILKILETYLERTLNTELTFRKTEERLSDNISLTPISHSIEYTAEITKQELENIYNVAITLEN